MCRPDDGCAQRTGVHAKTGQRCGWVRWLLPLTGLVALAWFLVRVVPKPSRATYPCQRAAFPLASGFVVWLLGMGAAAVAWRKARQQVREARVLVAASSLVVALALALVSIAHMPAGDAGADFVPSDPPNTPMGVARGIHPGRVAWVRDPEATNENWYDGCGTYYWQDTNTNQTAVDAMMSKALQWLTGCASDPAAWDALVRHFNQNKGHGDVGYRAGDKIAIKVNLNNCGSYDAQSNSVDVTPQVVRALLRQLVRQAGVPEQDITVYDAARYVADKIWTPCHDEFGNVRFVDKSGRNGRALASYDTKAPIHYNDAGVPGPDYPPMCVTEAGYLINLAVLKRHGLAAVTLGAKNHFGSIYHLGAGWTPAHLHTAADTRNRPMGSYSPLVDLMGHKDLGGKTMLCIVDALWCAWAQNGDPPRKWRLAPFNNDYPSSLLLSQDPVAMDSVALDFLQAEMAPYLLDNADNYLHQAAQPPATRYDPEHDGTYLTSLGAHEHWNSPAAKQYSRNLGMGNGIELVSSPPPVPRAPRVTAVQLNGRSGRSVSSIEPSGIGVRTIVVKFSEPVNFDEASVFVETVTFSDGVEALKETVVPRGITGSGTDTMTLTFAEGSVVDSWVKITLIASAIAGTQSYPLDGEPAASGAGRGYIYDANVDLPTGDGIGGGNAVFCVGSLRGDFNGDGLVTPEDIDGFFSRYTAGDPEADFRGVGFGATLPDGRITPADIDGFTSAFEEAVAENHGLDPLPAH